ncbi:5'-3' exonuclease, C-terminal domain [Pseudocohnilembus persalinus]|uniref:Exonuclease 1 n=1 Tax=Pseudocohnilembus persalinus TaxID=266149 RepID=A0A0V0QVB9_PSEPJ|nr:5'-3' exonuclease, C-terminal domain [Pseudocohnilembus persalinus]|eukprot:KRX06158.1 5'-3' exonuclease, C-terminal domain [Pseudocohnilembus persalinus]
MGIDSLLQFLKPITDKDHISKFAGKRAAIDASSWLYRACYGCSYELNMGIKTYGYIHYFQKLINLLQEYKITPIIVFDGKFLPAKEKTQQKRSGEKSKNREKAKEALQKGNISEARKWFTRCISITDDITFETQDYLKKQGIEIIVAPYEADAQISYLIKDDYADFVIAEDSDLIAYGCKKFLQQFLNYIQQYQTNIQIGINKAVDFLKKQKTVQNVVNSMRYDSKIKAVIPKDYQHSVIKVSKIFKFQRVYEPFSQQLTTLNPIPQDFQEHTLIGLEFDQVVEFAQGMIHPKTHQIREEKIINLDDIRKTKPQYSNFNQNSKNNVNNYQQPQIIEPQVQAQYQNIIQNNILPENDLIEVALNDQNEEQAQIMIEQFKKYDEIKNEYNKKDNKDNSSIYNNQIGKRKPEIIPKQKNSLDKYIIKVNKNAPN